MIPEAAVTVAAKVLYADKMSNHSGDNAPQIIDACEKVARKILEAAAPYMLSHERQQTADAHRDAIVNRDTADKLQEEHDLMRWKLDALKEWADAMINTSNSPQYGRDVRTLLKVASLGEAREIDYL